MGTFGVVLAVVVTPLVASLLVVLRQTLRKPGLICRLERDGDELVLRVEGAAALLCFRRTARAPLSALHAVRPLAAGEKERLHVRACGTSWPGFNAGYFWTKDRGLSFVARRQRHPGLELEWAGAGRIKHWFVEVDPADPVVAQLRSG